MEVMTREGQAKAKDIDWLIIVRKKPVDLCYGQEITPSQDRLPIRDSEPTFLPMGPPTTYQLPGLIYLPYDLFTCHA